MKSHFQYRVNLLKACEILYKQGHLSGMDGNVSVRINDEMILTTPTGRNKGWLVEEELVLCGMDGVSLENGKRPSTEIKMHLEVYKKRSDAQAVVHCHPIFATIYAASLKNLDGCYLTESIVAIGSVPKAELALPGTHQLAESIAPLVEDNESILLANHGAISFGQNLEVAVSRMESLEHFAKLSYYLELANMQNEPSQELVDQLQALRPNYGFNQKFTPCQKKVVNSQHADRLDVDQITKLVLAELSK